MPLTLRPICNTKLGNYVKYCNKIITWSVMGIRKIIIVIAFLMSKKCKTAYLPYSHGC